MEKLTIHPHDIRSGDRVGGFGPAVVTETAIDGYIVTVTFNTGRTWHIADVYEITVVRACVV